ncbi:Actin-binding protein Fragmin [Trichostrongylus colubriformis]|uniref:Actin-binding protein Fragmin n=1 Tax=Trichostrongylus colubriformis TaxID=6319 RepID=A0AAN8IE46_TRICO
MNNRFLISTEKLQLGVIMTNDDVDIKKVGKKPGLDVWRIKEFKLLEVPKNEYGQFYSGDTYIVMNTKWDAWDIHFWLGQNASLDEIGTAAMKAVEIDQALGGIPVQYREIQNHESPLFLSYFPNGIRYMAGGYDSGFHKVEDMFKNWKPKLFHCKGKRNVRCTQVEFKKESLNRDDVFLLDLGREIYVWMPPQSGRLERIKGMSRAKNIADQERVGQATVHVLDSDWDTDETFWSYFGGVGAARTIPPSKAADEDYWKPTTEKVTLYRVSDASGKMKVDKVARGEIKRSQLDSKDAFILDAVVGGVFVWIGKNCTMEERAQAMVMGAKYLKEKNLPTYTSVTRVLESAEPQSFIQWFGEWVDSKTKKSFQPRLYQVSDETGKMVVEEIANYDQESLDGDDVMIVDALNVIYVWVGTGANQNEKKNALQTAKKYMEYGKLPRHGKTSIEMVYQGKETPSFKKLFPHWDDELFQGDHRTVEQMRKQLFK